MIVWGVLTEQSIGSLFMAGVVPGLVVVVAFSVYIIGTAIFRPHIIGERKTPVLAAANAPITIDGEEELGSTLFGTLLVVLLVCGVLGGIWFGFFTPTEGAGVGAVAALGIGLLRGLRGRDVLEVVLSAGRSSAPLLLLLVMAQLYSRVLSMTGITGAVQSALLDTGLPPAAILGLMIFIWFLLGCIIDSISIILLTVPVFAPVAASLGYDPLAFAIIGILAIETGLLTPPFGILVFTVKAALPQENVSVGEIFRGSTPFWVCLLAVIVAIIIFPGIATWLPNLGKV
jgi:tripartite ATP-independent transporter DctM subunit